MSFLFLLFSFFFSENGGVKIEKQQNGTLSFYKNLYESRTWRDCMYLYPTPQSELYKNTNLNPQNAGW